MADGVIWEMSSPETDHRRDRRSSSINRSSGRYGKGQYDDNFGNRNFNNRIRNTDRSQVTATNFPPDVSELDIKDALHHEMGKFGDISDIYVRGRDHQRQAFVTFRSDDAARELRRYCLERHCKVIAFQKTLHFDFVVDEHSNGVGGGYNRNNNDDWGNNNGRHSSRGSYNSSNVTSNNNNSKNGFNNRNDYRNERFNGVGKDAGCNNNKNNRDRFNDHNDDRGGHDFRNINPRATRTLFVGNLDHAIGKDELLQTFEHWGAIDDIDVKRPPNGAPAYAFIKYLELEAASAARSHMVGREINGRPIKVGYGKTLPSTTLWIGSLGGWCTSEMLNREFDRFGALRNIDYVKGNRHAFIEFESIDAASAAYAEMRGFPLGGPDRKIKIDYTEPNRNRSDDKDRNDDNRNSEPTRGNTSTDLNRGNFGRGRGGGNFENQSNRKSDRVRNFDERNDRNRTRSRSPMINDREKMNCFSDKKEVSPNERTKGENCRSRVNSNLTENEKSIANQKTNQAVKVETSDSNSKHQENLTDVSKRFVVAWRGAFALKNSAFPVRMHLIGGNPELANFFLRGMGSGAGPALKVLSVTQRLRLDPPKLDEVTRRITQVGATGHCVLLALPTGEDIDLDSTFQRRPLKSLVTYFKKKEAAGVIILNSEGPSGKQEESGMLHAFPPCTFSQQQLLKVAPNLSSESSTEDHLVVIVVKGTSA